MRTPFMCKSTGIVTCLEDPPSLCAWLGSSFFSSLTSPWRLVIYLSPLCFSEVRTLPFVAPRRARARPVYLLSWCCIAPHARGSLFFFCGCVWARALSFTCWVQRECRPLCSAITHRHKGRGRATVVFFSMPCATSASLQKLRPRAHNHRIEALPHGPCLCRARLIVASLFFLCLPEEPEHISTFFCGFVEP